MLVITLTTSFLFDNLIITFFGLAFCFRRWQASTSLEFTVTPVSLKIFRTVSSKSLFGILRHVLDIKTLRSVYYVIFESHLCYASLFWTQNTNLVKRLRLLQNKFLRIMFFQSRNSHTGPLFKVSKILKYFDKTALENCIFISKSLKELLPPIFNGSNFVFSHTLMILDVQILVTLIPY